MAETLISPGVLARENDQSQILSQPIQVGAALVGPTVKGQVNIPKVITSYSEYVSAFGSTFITGSQQNTFFTSISAYNYFKNGGDSLLVTRVASGSFTPASSGISSSLGTVAFTLKTLGEGIIMNSSSSLNSKGSLASGSANNIRWEIVSPSSSSGTFSLIVRNGNDNTKSKSVLEVFNNLSLDPTAPNYISRIIGDQTQTLRGSGTEVYLQSSGSYPNSSRYIRVDSVLLPTPGYFNNNGIAQDQYTGSMPTVQSGSFSGATGTILTGTGKYYHNITNTDSQGLVGDNYTIALNLLANKDEFRFNVISTPGLIYSFASHATSLNTLISNIEGRGDAIIPLDLEGYDSTITAAIGTAATLDSSYCASYWPWVQIVDPDTRQNVWVPTSTLVPGMYASSDKKSEPWFAPAGISRGGLKNVIQTERKLINSDRNSLYAGKVNPLATFPGRGIVVFGNKTLQSQASSLDRINVRRLLIDLKGWIGQIADTLVFEQNTVATRNTFLSQVNPRMESVQQRQGLYAFKVVMDDSNNTPDVIDRNELRGAIYIQPTRTSEFIYLDFNILPTGAEFPS